MYLRQDQLDALQNLAFLRTKKGRKRVAMSEIVREAIDLWLKQQPSATKAYKLIERALGTAIASESALKKDWLRKEEDEAWRDL